MCMKQCHSHRRWHSDTQCATNWHAVRWSYNENTSKSQMSESFKFESVPVPLSQRHHARHSVSVSEPRACRNYAMMGLCINSPQHFSCHLMPFWFGSGFSQCRNNVVWNVMWKKSSTVIRHKMTLGNWRVIRTICWYQTGRNVSELSRLHSLPFINHTSSFFLNNMQNWTDAEAVTTSTDQSINMWGGWAQNHVASLQCQMFKFGFKLFGALILMIDLLSNYMCYACFTTLVKKKLMSKTGICRILLRAVLITDIPCIIKKNIWMI